MLLDKTEDHSNEARVGACRTMKAVSVGTLSVSNGEPVLEVGKKVSARWNSNAIR